MARAAGVDLTFDSDVVQFAVRLADLHECSHIVVLDDGSSIAPDPGPEYELIRVKTGGNPPEAALLARSVVLCAGDSTELRELRQLVRQAPVGLLTTTEGLDVLERRLREAELRAQFLGRAGMPRTTSLAVLDGPAPTEIPPPPAFRVVALMPTYNEEDVVEDAILSLAAEGIETYVIENWSTDATLSLVEGLRGRGVRGVERFPSGGPTPRYEWRSILERMEELALTLEADWFLHVDADERLKSPWPGVSLRDAIAYVDRCGFNCVDNTVIVFQPIDCAFQGGSVERYFRFFEFGRSWADFNQQKAWKNLRVPIVRADSGGHHTKFEGRRIYPFKFLLKHYPIRSQAHGERKVHRDRVARWSAHERELGWHVHYEAVGPEHCFLRDPAELRRFEEEDFNTELLIERLSGIGVPR